ncbi:MAG: hypothetical protein BECKG1743E_GA0114224_103293 [Candidatus Kentron sp. G]|nr:MAG: hypothetical protein BECKG1743E_GA0114224_103293 [Candidatus Kentron sp. G]
MWDALCANRRGEHCECGPAALRRLAEKNIPNCAGFSFGFKARGRRIVNYVTVIATQKLDDKDKQVGIFFDRNRLRYWFAIDPVRLFR